MKIIGIDTGRVTHGMVEIVDRAIVIAWDDARTTAMINAINAAEPGTVIAVEDIIGAYGPVFGKDLALTCQAVGIVKATAWASGLLCIAIPRQQIATYFCGTMRGCTPQKIREHVIDRWGGREARKGTKCPACKGKSKKVRARCPACSGSGWAIPPNDLSRIPLSARHVWSALAVAVMAQELVERNDHHEFTSAP
jgi:hypothetical protein